MIHGSKKVSDIAREEVTGSGPGCGGRGAVGCTEGFPGIVSDVGVTGEIGTFRKVSPSLRGRSVGFVPGGFAADGSGARPEATSSACL